MALSADTRREYGATTTTERLDVNSGATIYVGSALQWDGSALAVEPLVAGGAFAGFAIQASAPGTITVGDVAVDVYRTGTVQLTSAVSITAASHGTAIYASDDGTFTTASTSNTLIGSITRVIDATANTCEVAFESAGFEGVG